MTDARNIGEIIKRQRTSLGLTQGELAEASGLGVRQIARYEAGEQEPTLARAAALAGALYLTVDELAGATTKTAIELAWDDVLVATTRMATAWAQWQEALDRYAAAKRNQ